MHHKVAAFMLACVLASIEASAGPELSSPELSRADIGSTSLCGDSYVLALAPRRIGALSWQSRDALSMASSAQKALPQLWDNPETLAASPVKYIVFGPGEGLKWEAALKASGKQLIRLEWGENFSTVLENWKRLSTSLKEDARGAGRLNSLASLFDKAEAGAKTSAYTPKVLYLSRAGGTAGPGTYVDAVVKAAGGENIITEPGWQSPDIEYLVGRDPDIILTSFFKEGYESAQAPALRHQALRSFMARHEQVDIPGRLWSCAGPGLQTATDILANALQDWRQKMLTFDKEGLP